MMDFKNAASRSFAAAAVLCCGIAACNDDESTAPTSAAASNYLDFNNAHVQPTGKYHYHGVSQMLVDAYAADEDLVDVGFAANGFLMYYSKSGDYRPSYVLSATARSGSNCTPSGPDNTCFDLAGTSPYGTYTSDWQYSEGIGDLDECNGTTIDGRSMSMSSPKAIPISRTVSMASLPISALMASGPPPG